MSIYVFTHADDSRVSELCRCGRSNRCWVTDLYAPWYLWFCI